MNRAFTYSPAINNDGSYDIENGTLSSGRQGGSCSAVFDENEVTGERQYLITEQEQQSDLDYQRDTDEEYIANIIELYPNLQQMLAFGKEHYPPEFIIDFNLAMNGENDEERWEFLEMLDQDFRDAHPEVATVQEETTDANDVTQEQLDAAIDVMMEQEAGGEDTAREWMSFALEHQDDPIYAAIAMEAVEFHQGTKSQSECIETLLKRSTPSQLAPYYHHLTQG